MTKLTLSINGTVVANAKRYAARRGTSISAMVTRYLEAVTREDMIQKKPLAIALGPITLQATGLARMPATFQRK